MVIIYKFLPEKLQAKICSKHLMQNAKSDKI